jgi:hypothetical protein
LAKADMTAGRGQGSIPARGRLAVAMAGFPASGARKSRLRRLRMQKGIE